MKERMNKKGQELTLGTVILIVLGIVVLVFLVYGFSTGWNNLWSKITNYGGSKSNLDTIAQGCQLACLQQNTYYFCSYSRTVNFGTPVAIGSGQPKSSTTGNCSDMAKNPGNYPGLKVEPCNDIHC